MRVYAFLLSKNSAQYIVYLHPSSDSDFDDIQQSSRHFRVLIPLAGTLSLIKSVETSCGSECLSKAQKGAKFLFSRFWFVSLKNIFLVFVFHFQIRNDDSSNVQDSYNLSLNLLLSPRRLQSMQRITKSRYRQYINGQKNPI